MDTLILENLRCFKERQEVPLRPMTVLVGENSTGKSTFLAAVRIATDLALGSRLDFNEPPFTLGAYEQIASYSGGRGGRAGNFIVGFKEHLQSSRGGRHIPENTPRLPGLDTPTDHATGDEERTFAVMGQFVATGSQPAIAQLRIEAAGAWLTATRRSEGNRFAVETGMAGPEPFWQGVVDLPTGAALGPEILWYYIFASTHRAAGEQNRPPPQELGLILNLLGEIRTMVVGGRPLASAPIRTKPIRTYDPKSEVPTPEGSHVPMLLAKIATEGGDEWEHIRGRLNEFGARCGLFTDLRIRRMGRNPSDPFQVRVKLSGPDVNLVDVGYGVSQALPLLVDPLLGKRGQTFMLQQPEVHLHPRAQAELATYLAAIAHEKQMRFLIETHSDHLVERLRLDVRDHKTGLSPQDVLILYFHRDGPWVRVHPIEIDSEGNLVGAPEEYARFFLEEGARFFRV